jgi:hypothetical protein
MTFTGELPPLRGQTARRQTRLTFFKLGPDKVRQLSEDGGGRQDVAGELRPDLHAARVSALADRTGFR